MISAAEAASVLGCDQNTLRVTIKQAPERLGFPASLIGNRVRIPRLPFLRYLGVEAE
jgi:hypothetical protein